jgi:threonine/homoserine/homoserine lactone efflux protein
MDLLHSIFITGFIIGLGVAAPIGPIATLLIRQTLTYGFFSGLSAALAVILADGFYAWVAAILSSLIEGWMNAHFRWFYALGGAFLMYIGVKVLISHVQYNKNAKKSTKTAVLSSFFHTLFLTLASPMTTLLFIGWFNATGVFEKINHPGDIAAVVLGVMAGAAAWYAALVSVVAIVKKKYDLKIFRYVNLIAGTAIIAFSLWIIGKAILGIQ